MKRIKTASTKKKKLLKVEPFDMYGKDSALDPPLEPGIPCPKRLRGHPEIIDVTPTYGQVVRDLREFTQHFEGLTAIPMDEGEYHSLYLDGLLVIMTFLSRAEKHNDAANLSALRDFVRRLLFGMHALAASGNEEIMLILADTLSESVTNWEILIEDPPDLIKDWVKWELSVPGMISANLEKEEHNRQLARKLEVGANIRRNLLSTGRGRKVLLETPANGLANRLVGYMEKYFFVFSLPAMACLYEPPAWVDDLVRLEPFSRKNSKSWANVGWKIMAEQSPENDPLKHPVMRGICKRRLSRYNSRIREYEHFEEGFTNERIKSTYFQAFKQLSRVDPEERK